MGLRRLKYLYIVSILGLSVLVLLTVFRPMVRGEEYSEVRRDSLVKTGNEWVIQFNIINNEGCESEYRIVSIVNDSECSEEVLVLNERVFTYIYHIRQDTVTDDNVDFRIYRKGDNEPVKHVSYHLQ